MPHQLGVGFKFATELLIMCLCVTLYLNPDFILVGIDLENAYKKIWQAEVLRRHLKHIRLRGLVSYLRGKLGPRSPMWAKDSAIYDEEELLQGGPISWSAFSFTIHPAVVEAGAKLAVTGGCARFGMDDGYILGPREIVFRVLQVFRAAHSRRNGGTTRLIEMQMAKP